MGMNHDGALVYLVAGSPRLNKTRSRTRNRTKIRKWGKVLGVQGVRLGRLERFHFFGLNLGSESGTSFLTRLRGPGFYPGL